MTRILIADDHAVVRTGVRRILEDHANWNVVAEAADGKDAVAQAMATKPDVAIVDHSLPLIDGTEVTRQILDDEHTHTPQRLPVILARCARLL